MMTNVVKNREFSLTSCKSAVIDAVYRDRRVRRANGTDKSLDVYIPRDEGDYLYSLVRCLQPEVVVEVGMANGLSTLFIAQGLFDNAHGRHIAIDPFQFSDWGGAGIEQLRMAGLEHLVELVEKPSHHALPELEQAGVHAQLIFIDGNHLFDYVLTDFLSADRILDVGGLIAFDDADWPAITQVIRYILANRPYSVAFPEIVVEQAPGSPTVAGNLLRAIAGVVPQLSAKFRPDFLVSAERLGIRSRCVVLRKLGHDDRNGQSRFHRDF
jgi:predicted O-methyltransferase YrrM